MCSADAEADGHGGYGYALPYFVNGGENLLLLLPDLDGFDRCFEQSVWWTILPFSREEGTCVEEKQDHSLYWPEDPATVPRICHC